MNRLRIAALVAALLSAPAVRAAEPVKIGFCIELTGGLAGTGKGVLLATRMWAERINAGGGLLGRPVELVYYDDQSNPTNVPGIYTKLIDVDRVDLIISGYSTAAVAPAMPMAIQHGMLFIGLMGLNINDQFHYDRYFSIASGGPVPQLEYSKGFFEVAMTIKPKPKTVAIVAADLEYAHVASGGARENAKRYGLKIVYDGTYPPTTTDFAPVVRAVQAANPDVVYIASYPPDSAGLVIAASEVGLKAAMFGGGMIGVQYAALKQRLGPLLNGITTMDLYAPEPTLDFPGIKEFLADYQRRAPAEGVDVLGFFGPPLAYARMQIIEQAVTATKSLDQKTLAAYIHKANFPTVAGDMHFNQIGERPEGRLMFVQYQGIAGHDVNQFKQPGRQVIVYPPMWKSGEFRYPYTAPRP